MVKKYFTLALLLLLSVVALGQVQDTKNASWVGSGMMCVDGFCFGGPAGSKNLPDQNPPQYSIRMIQDSPTFNPDTGWGQRPGASGPGDVWQQMWFHVSSTVSSAGAAIGQWVGMEFAVGIANARAEQGASDDNMAGMGSHAYAQTQTGLRIGIVQPMEGEDPFLKPPPAGTKMILSRPPEFGEYQRVIGWVSNSENFPESPFNNPLWCPRGGISLYKENLAKTGAWRTSDHLLPKWILPNLTLEQLSEYGGMLQDDGMYTFRDPITVFYEFPK